ncbi:MAG: Na+/H+ antiporter subunit D [Nanohaloarchaea archaeon]|nr:Na+/H+ antiporter subunit D [Candidatus Nanohaloarchaea archaeon]
MSSFLKQSLRQIGTFIVLYIAWILFTYSLDVQELVIGFVVSLIVSVFVHKYTEFKIVNYIFNPFKAINFFVYLVVLVIVEIQSHLSVARAIITGRVHPAIVKVSHRFNSDLGRVLLANSITFTPGTVSVSIGKSLYVHCLNYEKNDKIDALFTKYGLRVFD